MKKAIVVSVGLVTVLLSGCGHNGRPQDIRIDQYNQLQQWDAAFHGVLKTGQELSAQQDSDLQAFLRYEHNFERQTATTFPATQMEKDAILLLNELNLDYYVYTQSSTASNKQGFQSDLKYFDGVINGEYSTHEVDKHIATASNSVG
ncbi:hypothetical protein JZ785_27120 [Alicyclobacillus curvatus]|nr:hypothetical protein JZ785_27120 [Alicyclobacillus curvatus]